MALWELDEFQGPRFLGFVRNVPVPEAFSGRRWLPDRTINDLSFDYIKGSFDRPVMAHLMGWDSEAPIHGRPGLGERVQGELPPIKRKARFSEKEIIRFLTPRAGSSDVQDAINSVYRVTAQLLDSVQARVEWLRLQALSEDTVAYNEGGFVMDFDFGITPEYQIDLTTGLDGAANDVSASVGDEWDEPTTGNGILTLQYLCDKIEDETGFRPAEVVMSRKAVGHLLRQDDVRGMIRGSSAPSTTLTRAEVDTIFDLYNLPPIRTYDVVLNSEEEDGTYTEVRPLAQNKAFLVPGGGTFLGETLWGPTAESRPLIGTNLQSQAPGIFATTYGTDEPPEEWVKAVGVSFPSMPGANLLGQITLWSV